MSRSGQDKKTKRKFLPFPMIRLEKVNLANQLTLLRMAMVLPFIVLFLSDMWAFQWMGFVCFVAACITDGLDGYIARKRGLITTFGKIMDPLADKLLMLTAMISLVQVNMVPGWMVAVIWWRELAVTGLRTLAATHAQAMAADSWGKIKTVFQMTAVITGMVFYITQNTLDDSIAGWKMRARLDNWWGDLFIHLVEANALVYWLMVITTAISLFSGIVYFRRNWTMVAAELEEEDKAGD